MGYREIQINLAVELFDEEIRRQILKRAGIKQGEIRFLRRSLDSRKKERIVWNILAGISSSEIKGGTLPPAPRAALDKILDENRRKRPGEKALVVGSGPAGIFAGLILLRLGYPVTLIERGAPVEERKKLIQIFEGGGNFSPRGNYLFGEGGAGTFSDGKLTSRTKKIVKERDWIYGLYAAMGGPEEILWSTHPHLGSDRLFDIARNMRHLFQNWGGEILFNTTMTGLKTQNSHIKGLEIEGPQGKGVMEGTQFFLALGHSARETYHMLLNHEIPFISKNFALGFRMEHEQKIINMTQWGREELPGVKGAEYRLTHKNPNGIPVYTFCMCPGGVVVPSTPYGENNIVNGMSNYARDGQYANAALVAGVKPSDLGDENISPRQILDWLEQLERRFKEIPGNFAAPSCRIEEFLTGKGPTISKSSYPLGLKPWPLEQELPPAQTAALKEGLTDFVKKMPLLRQGRLLGLESKTSAPIQVVQDEHGRPQGWDNLWICGEGSGRAGGIVSSAAHGITAVLSLLNL
jgi:uncharacterized FAD-dependent dehydrogenase